MTTIAWDGKMLASDTLACAGTVKDFQSKIFPLGDYAICGFAGESQIGRLVMRWLIDTQCRNIHTGVGAPLITKDDDFSMLLVLRDDEKTTAYTLYHLQSRCVGIPIMARRYYAIGSGREFAMATMRLGFDAKMAVKAAIELDPYTGGEVETLCLP